MDTEDFIVSRASLLERLQTRRAKDLTSYPFRMIEDYGVKFPAWTRLALSFITQGGALARLMEMGLPLVVPFLFRKKLPFMERLVLRIFSPKS
jgi:hypothetical protein